MITTVRRCRSCSCTDECACPGGCSWVEADLCSACVGEPRLLLTQTGHLRHHADASGQRSLCGQELSPARTHDHFTEFGEEKYFSVHRVCKVCTAVKARTA